MSRKPADELSRRERQIMDIVYARGEASAADVLGDLPDPPSYSAVRALLAILVEKGHLKHRPEAGRYIYSPDAAAVAGRPLGPAARAGHVFRRLARKGGRRLVTRQRRQSVARRARRA